MRCILQRRMRMGNVAVIEAEIKEFINAYMAGGEADGALMQALFDKVCAKLRLTEVCLLVKMISRYEFRYEVVSTSGKDAQKRGTVMMDPTVHELQSRENPDGNKVYEIDGSADGLFSDGYRRICTAQTIGGAIQWIVSFEKRDVDLFSDDDRESLRMLADAIRGFASFKRLEIVTAGAGILHFANKKTEAHDINRQLYEDSLTKVMNRKYLDEQLARTICEGLVMADMDHFKKINDRAGHQAGDAVLAKVGETLLAAVRNTDSVVRYGGDEFLISFREISPDDFKKKVEEMKAAVRAITLPDYPRLSISMSFGAVYGKATVSSMIAEADKALYQSKKTRNIATFLFFRKS